ncbi:nuclear cap-binding protein, putative [Eimeria maxima]|uniref:Nuclear cap-binding protein subunit 2 n=1 Tax=Eimeria maxima TaxID=5804 RepID=U6LWR3_EIMMA|nr:nuclear cap-binding protein, putative [Eimeria maxima]CDJ56397.1 nuclear cap-binding protein, putative [Eimeria maxima]
MAELYEGLEKVPTYYDRRTCTSLEDWKEAVQSSRAVYVGNLNYFTTEEELYELVSHAGSVDRIVMGLNRLTRAPCGFAFVLFRTPQEAKVAVQILSGAQCDGRVIRVDPDSGRDIDGDRKYGRGTSGRQWRDEWRDFYDPGRGGQGGEHGKRAREEFEASLIASRMPPVDPRAYPRNVRHKWVPGGGGVPGGPVGGGPPGFGPPGARPPGGPRRGPPPFGGPPPPDDRRHQSHENPFAYNRKFARGRRN